MRQKKQRTTFFSSLQHSCRDQEKKYNDHKNDMDTLFIVRIAHWSYSIYLKCCLMTSYDIFIVSSTSLFNNKLRDNKSVLLRSTHRLCVCVRLCWNIFIYVNWFDHSIAHLLLLRLLLLLQHDWRYVKNDIVVILARWLDTLFQGYSCPITKLCVCLCWSLLLRRTQLEAPMVKKHSTRGSNENDSELSILLDTY